jgi:hypothetical protein
MWESSRWCRLCAMEERQNKTRARKEKGEQRCKTRFHPSFFPSLHRYCVLVARRREVDMWAREWRAGKRTALNLHCIPSPFRCCFRFAFCVFVELAFSDRKAKERKGEQLFWCHVWR